MLLLLLDEGGDLGALHNLDFAMIKYPRKRKHSSLPHERVFTMDYDNQVMSKIIIYLTSYIVTAGMRFVSALS